MTKLVETPYLQSISALINPRKYAVFGFLSLLITAGWLGAGYQWEWLSRVQENDLYKQLSGVALLVIILQQWRFGLRRLADKSYTMGFMDSHKLVGCILPIFILFHIRDLGIAYQRVLAIVILVNCLIGILNVEILRIGKPFFHNAWMASHIGLATIGLTLAFYHIYVVYLY
uniref:Uncharacterized protein n=1 Tax=Candidatus Kentrum sp. TC TaxID=2126339 RepID=A0A450Z6H4_9GAMM|nr:MAG: hypothetical protein BECKTC1821E_GA0114239_104515 [Candidatus Kentron sp. TC]VFK49288.1 MAG: hypothetical protein BECKTC1821D_GA0114238_10744 [Candidatus Kentron sp. TC]VFK55678.1 MAG: hypothetical protein BECKTC1821F_GA0114240_100777 [Candidatus Kentron sp. TC]